MERTPCCKSHSLRTESLHDRDRLPTNSSRVSVSSFETEKFIADDEIETDTHFQLFWRDESRSYPTPRIVNYSLPKASWQPFQRSHQKSLCGEKVPEAADRDLQEVLDSYAFRSDATSPDPPFSSSTPVLSEPDSRFNPASPWELAAFDSDSLPRAICREPKAEYAVANHLRSGSGAQTAPATGPVQSIFQHAFACKQPSSARTGNHPNILTSNQSSDGPQSVTRRDVPVGHLWSDEVHLKTSQRESGM